jgi:ribosome modulation factor
MKTPYEQGYQAKVAGVPFEECPYETGSAAAIAWGNGWRDAQTELDDLNQG